MSDPLSKTLGKEINGVQDMPNEIIFTFTDGSSLKIQGWPLVVEGVPRGPERLTWRERLSGKH